MTIPRLRSVLYLPASNARAIAKAATLPCDGVILDLEDAVAPEEKRLARDQALAALRHDWGGRAVVVRANALDTPWGADDLQALVQAGAPAALLPKVDGVADLHAARERLGVAGPALWAMVETCAGALALPALAGAAELVGLRALVLGGNDLAKAMRARPGPAREPLLPILSQMVLAARSAGIAALDAVCNALDQPAQLETECRQARDWGCDGKTLIHPSQIAAANRAFDPEEAELAWAERVVAAFAAQDAKGKGAIRLDGRMVERLHLDEARRTLSLRSPPLA